MSRHLLGIIAAILLVLGFVVWLTGPGGSSKDAFAGGCIRVGLVLGALWLAVPQLQAMITGTPRWIMGLFVGKKNKNQPTESPGQPPPRQPRPRRRSTSR